MNGSNRIDEAIKRNDLKGFLSEVLREIETVQSQVRAQSKAEGPTNEAMFDFILGPQGGANPSVRAFIEGLRQYQKANGYLSPKQTLSLQNTYNAQKAQTNGDVFSDWR